MSGSNRYSTWVDDSLLGCGWKTPSQWTQLLLNDKPDLINCLRQLHDKVQSLNVTFIDYKRFHWERKMVSYLCKLKSSKTILICKIWQYRMKLRGILKSCRETICTLWQYMWYCIFTLGHFNVVFAVVEKKLKATQELSENFEVSIVGNLTVIKFGQQSVNIFCCCCW